MARRADIARFRFVSWSAFYAERYFRAGDSFVIAARDGIGRALAEAEHGGIGIGRTTAKWARKNWTALTETVARKLATNLIAEGC